MVAEINETGNAFATNGSSPPGSGPYGRAAEKVRGLGWRAVPADTYAKGVTVSGVTGYEGEDLSPSRLEDEIRHHGHCNIGIVMPANVVAIDVDLDEESGKDGEATAAEIMDGFPATYSNGHGDDDSPYRHFFYRVPDDVTPQDVANLGAGRDGVDVLRWMHRWSRVSPSVHTSGEPYYWLDPDGEEAKTPRPDDLPQLTREQWEQLVSVVGSSHKTRYGAVSVDVEEWLEAHAGEPDAAAQAALDTHWGGADGSTAVERHGSHHAGLTACLLNLAHLGEEGHQVGSAIAWVEANFLAYRSDQGEVDRALSSGIEQAVGKSESGSLPVVVGEDGVPLAFVRPAPAPRHTPPRHVPGRGAEGVCERFPRLDLAALVDPNRPPRCWLLEGVVPEGDQVSIVAPGGTGKSLFVLALAVEAVWGASSFIGRRIYLPPTGKVLYIDMENSEDDWAERLKSMGVTTETAGSLDRLVCLHLPNLGGLDTEMGARDLMDALDAYGIGSGDVLVLDSIQRVTSGPENDADTFRNLYNHTSVKLKRRGITVIRTDNTGKDASLGPRGSSGKRDDVGYSWVMERGSKTDEFKLSNAKRRASGGSEGIRFERKQVNGVLRFLPPIGSSHTEKEVKFKTTASRVLRASHDANEVQGTDDAMTQTAVLRAVKDEGVKFRDQVGHAWLADLVKDRCAVVEETKSGGTTTKNYRWRSDYTDPTALDGLSEGVADDDEQSY